MYRAKLLSQAIKSLTPEEREVLWQSYRDSETKGLGIDPALFSDFYPKMSQGNELDFSNIRLPDTICAGLVHKVKRGENISIGGPKKAAVEKKKEEIKEVVKEKTNFDVIMKGFAPEGKVKIIKEIKNLMSLGLKESKDKVESCLVQPIVIYKSAPTEKANELLAKFKELGADVELK